MKTLFLFSLLVLLIASGKVSFSGHKVLRLQLSNASEIEAATKIIEQHNLDVWSDTLYDIRVPPHLADVFAHVPHTVFIEDIQKLIDHVEVQHLKAAPGDFFDTYRTSKEVMDWINALKASYPDLITTTEIGKTVQGQSIVAVHLQSSKGSNKPRIVYNSCQHSREWITVTTLTYVLNALTSGYGKNSTYTALVDAIDWTFIPIVNVDGYDYTWKTNRLWRKNRRPNPKGGCDGVDTNRNWPYMWNTGGSSNDPCSDAYHGPSAGSEPENMALANFVKNTPRVAGYIDFHSYSQLWMSPWGYTYALPKDYTKMQALMVKIVAAIRNTHGKKYDEGNIANTIYVASGSSADYSYSVGVVYSFAVELRDQGQSGFILPPSQIKPQAEEIIAAVLVMGGAIKAEYPASQ
jgi:murein tripeptide amidase MpaA